MKFYALNLSSKQQRINELLVIFFSNKDNYKVLFIIDFKYSNNCELDCLDISKLSLFKDEEEVLFKIFSFFKIISVEIEKNDKKAKIKLASIGREENFESKLNLLDRGKIQLNISKNILEIK